MRKLLTRKFDILFISYTMYMSLFIMMFLVFESVNEKNKELYVHNSYLHNCFVVSSDKTLRLFSHVYYEAK
jgi:hypothetical protein